MSDSKNVLGTELEECCTSPMTGFTRTGSCEVPIFDVGVHAVCIQATKEFLEFSRFRGNDLSTPSPENEFPGLKPGDRWCLCAARWAEALEHDMAPKVYLRATHEAALQHCDLADLKRYAIDLS